MTKLTAKNTSRKAPQVDANASRDFLLNHAPTGPWRLVTFNPDGNATRGTFGPEQLADMREWIERHGSRNTYFHVADLRRSPARGKANKEDVGSVRFLWVDLDTKEAPKEELHKKLTTTRLQPLGIPPPTRIVDSGNGWHAYWELSEPVVIDGDLEKAADFERYLRQLAIVLGGDLAVAEVSRIMRLPGTINVPTEAKRKRGIIENSLAFVRAQNKTGERFPLASFQQAPLKAEAKQRGATVDAVPSGIDYFAPLSDDDLMRLLPLQQHDRVRAILRDGGDPDSADFRWHKDHKEYDRSHCMWHVLCECVRIGDVSDETLVRIQLARNLLLSGHQLEHKGYAPLEYAVRQVQRAKDHAIDPDLARLNDQFFVVGYTGGKCVAVERINELYNAERNLWRTRVLTQTRKPFEDRIIHPIKFVPGGFYKDGTEKPPKPVELGNWWWRHERRRSYTRIVFAPPPLTTPTDCYNLWQGFAVEPRRGSCRRYLRHMWANVCRRDRHHFKYLIRWMARVAQEPGSAGQVAILLRGDPGVGKNIWAEGFAFLFGQHTQIVTQPEHVAGKFNAHLRDCVVLFADEAFLATEEHARILRGLITGPTINVEGKGRDMEPSPNFVHLILASNDTGVINMLPEERRYLVLDVGREKKGDQTYFRAILNEMQSGGREALLDMLMRVDLSKFEVRIVPKTEALEDEIDAGKSQWHDRIINRLRDVTGVITCDEALKLIDVPEGQIKKEHVDAVKKAFEAAGWERCRPRINKHKTRCFAKQKKVNGKLVEDKTRLCVERKIDEKSMKVSIRLVAMEASDQSPKDAEPVQDKIPF